MTVHNNFKTWRSVNTKKILQVQSQKPSSAMMKLALMSTATGMEDSELPLLQRIRLLESYQPQNCSPNKCFRVQVTDISTSTLQRTLCESGLYGWIAVKKQLLKDTNYKKRLAWAKKHKQWTLDRWKFVLWSDESKLRFLVPTAVSLWDEE